MRNRLTPITPTRPPRRLPQPRHGTYHPGRAAVLCALMAAGIVMALLAGWA